MTAPRLATVLAGATLFATPAQPVPTLPACLDHAPKARFILPAPLREVSGLAWGADGRLWLHNDELGLIGALDPATGRALGSYRLGPTTRRGDFEGVAEADGRLYLITSTGRLHVAPVPARTVAGGNLAVEVIDTGLGRECEIEGLGYEPAGRVLLIACKSLRDPKKAKEALVFRWSIETRRLATPDRIALTQADLSRGRKRVGFHPSAIERHPVSGAYVLLASADQAFAIVDRAGAVVEAGLLPKRHHQPEGLAFGPTGDVYISDEGGNGKGTITVYACR